jgi:four helix bundle protein
MRDHRKLDAFRLADDLAVAVYQTTRSFPKSELFGLTSQVRRATVSVPANIVEGCGRSSERDFLRFLGIAFASVREVGYLIDLSNRLGFVDEQKTGELLNLQGRVAAALIGLIRSMQ